MSSRRYLVVLALLVVLAAPGCAKNAARSMGGQASAAASPAQQTAGKLPPTPASGRRIIRNASLSMTVTDPAATQQKASDIARKLGGYVESAQSRRLGNDADAPLHVSLELRVPADHLDRALADLRKLATGVDSEQIESRDVTDQYIDLDARLKAQKALEQQYLEILKHADKVSDALDVQKQLASVRTAIEKLEGRKRVLDNQIELSTIKLELDQQQPLVSASFSSLSNSAKHAGADVIDVGAALVSGLIRLAGVLLPVFLLLGVPALLVLRFLLGRMRRRREVFGAS